MAFLRVTGPRNCVLGLIWGGTNAVYSWKLNDDVDVLSLSIIMVRFSIFNQKY